MEHSLTATNSFSNNDAKNTNIYTCNCNGCHEPQQIDYILSSGHSLRSRTFLTHRLLHRITGDSRPPSRNATGKHWEKTRQETDRMGMQRPHRIQRHRAHAVESGQELRLCDNSSFALYVYTDGSAGTRREHRNALDGDSQP